MKEFPSLKQYVSSSLAIVMGVHFLMFCSVVGVSRGNSNSSSTESESHTPMGALSRTPNSTSPPTPSANKVSVGLEKLETTRRNTKSRHP